MQYNIPFSQCYSFQFKVDTMIRSAKYIEIFSASTGIKFTCGRLIKIRTCIFVFLHCKIKNFDRLIAQAKSRFRVHVSTQNMLQFTQRIYPESLSAFHVFVKIMKIDQIGLSTPLFFSKIIVFIFQMVETTSSMILLVFFVHNLCSIQ